VKVNQIIRPVRYDGQRAHFYSEYENHQFDEESSMKWFARFDEASALLDGEEPVTSSEPVRISRWTDETAPHAGQWAAIVNGTTEYIQTGKGRRCPPLRISTAKNTAPAGHCLSVTTRAMYLLFRNKRNKRWNSVISKMAAGSIG
jgi:hypothetical protein